MKMKILRPIDYSKPVRVYWNLHRHCYSVQQRGLVVAHAQSVTLHSAGFKVSEAGRQRVLREGRKNVHAFVTGYLTDGRCRPERCMHRVIYNPHRHTSFILFLTKEKVEAADVAHLDRELFGKPRIRIPVDEIAKAEGEQ